MNGIAKDVGRGGLHPASSAQHSARPRTARTVRVGDRGLPATLSLLPGTNGLVIWAVASGCAESVGATGRALSDELVPVLAQHGLATLFMDLGPPRPSGKAVDPVIAGPTSAEASQEALSAAALAVEVMDWAAGRADLAGLRTGLCAADAAAAGALMATTQRPARVAAVVARSGRPDLAGPALARVSAPTLLIVGGNDPARVALNRTALLALNCEKRLEVVPGAGPCFDEPGARATMLHLAASWLAARLGGRALPH